jgi:hypothetical protein
VDEDDDTFDAIDQHQHQSSMVWEITMQAWEDAIVAFKIKSPMVPHRDYSHLN